jgi:CO/xanthine dehydrogenase Mo-binding subunit
MSGGLTRRTFVKAGGALVVSLGVGVPRGLASIIDADAPENPSDPGRLASWLEIRADNTILVRTGRTEIGTGMSAYYAQTIAEELRVQPESITLVMGDTDRTPDGGYSAGLLGGAANLRKVGAYTYQALLALAATRLGVPVRDVTVANGVASGGGRQVSYGELVRGQQLELTIPIKGTPTKIDPANFAGIAGLDGFEVTGDPPLRPVHEYTVVGKSHPMPGIPDKVTGRTQWSCDVAVPGMLHARLVRPATLGSTLVSVGALDTRRFPTAQIVRKDNLLAVVSPNEWEAVGAAQAVAAGTKWSAWSGLPGSDQLTRTLRAHAWGKPASRGTADEVHAALAAAATTVSATYEQPYVRHAPIGPFVAVADVGADGRVTVWTHSSNSQGLRARLAHLIGTSTANVTVRWLDHAGQFGRTTFGGDGAEADAVILSQLTGKPVRVQWTLSEDLTWSTVSAGWVEDIRGALDASGRLTAIHSAFYSPHFVDARPIGGLLAGLPQVPVKTGGNEVMTEWPYDKIPRLEQAYGMENLGHDSPYGGLRGNIMRTPGQRQQNFALEGLMTEAAAAAGADPIAFRIAHTSDRRLIDILEATAKAAGWDSRPSRVSQAANGAARNAAHAPTDVLTGRGVAIIVRTNAYWAGIAEVAVTPATGVVQVTKFTIGVECGKIINPRQLDRCMRAGLTMGLSEALKEEVTFDQSTVTSTDWTRYKILTMAETPEINVVQISRDDKGFGAGGEAPNALGPPAVAAAFLDATGVPARRIPLTPAYVKRLLQA